MRDEVAPASALCVVLVSFDGGKRAARIRRPLGKQLGQQGGAIVDAAIIGVDGEGKVRVHDPHRTVAGLLTAALTWGVFGLLSGGLVGLMIWAVIGAVCGGLFAYYREQPLSGRQLRRIGKGMRRDSSAIVVFLKCRAEEAVLSTAATFGPTTASLVAISRELSASVLADADAGAGASRDASGAVPGGPLPAADRSTLLNMLLVRLPGQLAVRQALAELAPAKTPDPSIPQVNVELVLESDPRGGLYVHSPNFGVRFSARSSLMSWGVLGLIFGAIAGFSGGGGILRVLEGGLITGAVWGAFGLLAGALYGLFVGRVLSGRHLKQFEWLVPPNSSLAFVWADGDLTNEAIDRWAPRGSQRLVVRFESTSAGSVLTV
jgi:uncharacterized membrane protein